jgi:hypothetical protein
MHLSLSFISCSRGRLPRAARRQANTVLPKVIYKNSYANTINAPCLFYTLSTQFQPGPSP